MPLPAAIMQGQVTGPQAGLRSRGVRRPVCGEFVLCRKNPSNYKSCHRQRNRYDVRMRDLVVLFVHLIATVARLAGPGGARSVVAESLLLKHQLLIINRSRQRAPNLRPMDRIVIGLCALLMSPTRLTPFIDHASTFHNPGRPQDAQEAEVPLAIHAKSTRQTGSEGSFSRARRSRRCDETAKSPLGLSPYRSTDLLSLWRRHRQRRGSADSRKTLPP